MRIVSLLPALTELVASLGRQGELVGVTHECDFPPGVEALPHLTRSRIPVDATSGEIDALVSREGAGLYDLDAALLARLRPDLILTQEQCDVCAVSEITVRRTALGLSPNPWVESVNPTDLAGVFAMFRRVGELIGARPEAKSLVESFERTAAEVARRRKGRPHASAAVLEWLDPPFTSGHWNPEILALAGGRDVFAVVAERSRRLTWEEVSIANPEVLLLSPCGFSLARSAAELPDLASRPEWAGLQAVRTGRAYLVDGSAYFSRPGPRLETSLRIAAACVAPDLCGDLGPAEGWRSLAP